MLPILLLGLTLMMRFFPEASLSRFLHTYLVKTPVRWSLGLDRQRVVFFLIVIGLSLTASEMVAILGTDFLLAYSWHLTLYLDGMAVAAALAVLSRLKATARYVRTHAVSIGARSIRRFRGTARSHTSARPVERGTADNDDDGPRAYAKAA